MTDLVRRDTDGWAAVLPAIGDLAGKISGTDFVPDAMRGKPAAVAAAILFGRELGMEPMTALRAIAVIKGKPTLSAEAMRGLVLSHGHDIRFVEMTATRCVVEGRRRGQDEPTRVTFTMDDAKRMGLAGQQQYAKMPRQMLSARATAELCRLVFADVIGGLLVDVEVEDDVEAGAPAAPAGETMQRARKPRTTVVEAEPVLVDIPAEEPVIDDVVDAEVVDDGPGADAIDLATGEALAAVQDVMDAEVIEIRERNTDGIKMARQALAEARGDRPPMKVSARQLTAIQAAFKACGIEDRVERLNIARAFAGRDALDSATDLTADEAHNVLDGLATAQASGEPAAFLRQVAKVEVSE